MVLYPLLISRQFKSVFAISTCILTIVLAQNNCTSDENCEFNQYCNLEGNCNSCIECEKFNRRNSANETCPKNITQDCGDCLPGFSSKSVDDDPICEKIKLGFTSDVQPTTTILYLTNATASDQPTYDEFDLIRPWIYVGLAVTFFVLCGTCGVVGFKVYVQPRQKKFRAYLRDLRAKERAEMNALKTRKSKEDTTNSSPEELQRLYPDLSNEFKPLTSRLISVKNVQELSH